jgi:hypothetical protein
MRDSCIAFSGVETSLNVTDEQFLCRNRTENFESKNTKLDIMIDNLRSVLCL